MRKLSVPATLILAPLAFGCSSTSSADAGLDVIDALDVVIDTSADRADVTDVNDVTDAGDAPASVCEGARDADGGVFCREENVQGTGLFCIRYRCAADDGGVSLGDCCRLVG